MSYPKNPSHCFVAGCDSGYRKARRRNKALQKRNPSMFKAPNDPQLLEAWRKAIPWRNKVLSSADKLCELHFEDDCILHYFETKFPGGIVHRITRERGSLKPGSVPTKFQNLSPGKQKRKTLQNSRKKMHPDVDDDVDDSQSLLSSSSLKAEMTDITKPNNRSIAPHNISSSGRQKRKAPTPQCSPERMQLRIELSNSSNLKAEMVDVTKQNNCWIVLHDNLASGREKRKALIPRRYVDDDLDNSESLLSFSNLKAEMTNITKPKNWWIASQDDYIVCGKLDEALQCERHVVISEDLSVKVFLRNKEICLPVIKNAINSIEKLSIVLQRTDDLII